MLVYSKKLALFSAELNTAVRQILSREMGLKLTTRYFLYKNTYYSIEIVIYNHQKALGYFDPEFRELGFHESLMHASKTDLYNIIRHELAHYITFIEYGSLVLPHGNAFKTFCLSQGWGEEVFRASICLDEAVQEEKSEILRKVQKLMALAKSSNPHEAELAMVKSQQLLLKHNLDNSLFVEEGEKFYLKRVLKQGKMSAKMRAIAKILETFFVNIVFRRADNLVCLEILGNKVNVEIADYVAAVLDDEFENLWNQARKMSPLMKGQVAKNSFFQGIAKGYCNKIHSLQNASEKNALMVIEKMLVEAKDLVYPRLSKSTSNARSCPGSAALGELMGRSLTINPAVKSSQQNVALLMHR